MIGVSLCAGRFAPVADVGHALGSGALWVARDTEDGAACLVTGVDRPRRPAAVATGVGLDVAGVAELRFLGETDSERFPFAAVELEPPGRPLTELIRDGAAPAPVAASIGRSLAEVALRVHERTGRGLGGIHPRLVYARGVPGAFGFSGVAPRHVRLVAAQSSEFRTPALWPILDAPEMFRLPARAVDSAQPTDASDVFSIAALLVWLCTTRAPYGETPMDLMLAHASGQVAEIPRAFFSIGHALSPDPTRRPSLRDMIAALGRLAR